MIRASRREALIGAALAGGAAAMPLAARAMGTGRVLVFDSRLPESRAFARSLSAAQTHDLADAHATRFAALRAPLPRGSTVEGLTRWSDLVALRRELGRQGLRLASEQRTTAGLYRWSMR